MALLLSVAPLEGWGQLPLAFEEPVDHRTVAARGRGYGIVLAPEGPTLILPGCRVGFSIGRANRNARAVAEVPLPGRINDYRGADPTRWRTGVRTFARVRYR